MCLVNALLEYMILHNLLVPITEIRYVASFQRMPLRIVGEET